MTNVKTSTPLENIKNDDDVFVWIKKCILKSVFGFGSIGFSVIRSVGSLDIGKMFVSMYLCMYVPKCPISTQITLNHTIQINSGLFR